ncbi:hypothetical protein [Kosakonia radicincitans]|uniref:hypothetical protein n=1 Tax=Kosakonia radicincitans TaxID=283686 RepID=UPI001D08AFA4|nr:hypothetical protein [Kosakonia radicincitans]
MLFRNMLLKYYAPTEDGSDPGAPGGDQPGNEPPQGSDPAKQNPNPNPLNTGDPEKPVPPQKFPDNWRDTLAGDDAKYRKQLERYASPEALAKAHRELQAKLSSGEFRAAKLPENPTDEEIAQWRKDNGVPEKADDYLADLPSGIVLGDEDKERISSFLEAMHGKNVSKEHVQAAIEWNQQMVEQEMQARYDRNVEAQQKTEDALRQEWGPEYRRNINLINGMLDGLPKDAKALFTNAQTSDGVSIFNNPDVAKWLVDVARAVNPVATVVPGASNPQAITDEITALEKRMRDDYEGWFKDNAAQERLRQLYDAQERLG